MIINPNGQNNTKKPEPATTPEVKPVAKKAPTKKPAAKKE